MFSNRRFLLAIFSTAFLVSLLGLFGCGDDDLPEYYLLDRLRVVAAVASAPEVAAATAGITVTFHVSDPQGAGRTLSYTVEKCVDPGIGLGATPTCSGNPTATATETGNFVPGSAATNYYGTFTTAAFAVPSSAVIFTDPTTGLSRSAADQYNGVGYLVIVTLTTPSGESLKAFKRIIVSTRPTLNQNPSFNGTPVLFDGVAPAAYTLTTTRFPVRASVPSSSAESYQTQNDQGAFETQTEELTVTWLVSTGVMRYSRTGPAEENRFTPPNPLSAVTTFIAVLRDDRGGTSVVDIQK